jgi:hypothetical protein
MSEIHLTWSLSNHIQNKKIEEALIVVKQMTIDELMSSSKSIKTLLAHKNSSKIKKMYRCKTNQLKPIEFLQKKLEIIENELLNRK